MKVEQFYNKNQFIIRDEENKKVYFQSYNSTIAIYDRNTQTLTLGEDWDYSKTTLRHLYLFIEDETFFNLPEKNRKKHIEKLIADDTIKYHEDLK